MTVTFKNIGVVGAGTMGISLAVDLVYHQTRGVLVDIDDRILASARAQVREQLRFAPLLNPKLERGRAALMDELLTFTTSPAALADCDFVVENVTEDVEIKRAVYGKLDGILAADTIIGVNTSCIPITRIGGYIRNPARVAGMHLMNPVHLKSHAEVIRGAHTSEETLAGIKAFLAQLDKRAIVVNDYPGFVSNRISHLFMNEAAFVVQDQVAEPRDVDEIFKKCFGHAMGPLETADLIGLDTVVDSLRVLYESYQDPKYRCCPLLKKHVEAGRLGRKTGIGFYNYK